MGDGGAILTYHVNQSGICMTSYTNVAKYVPKKDRLFLKNQTMCETYMYKESITIDNGQQIILLELCMDVKDVRELCDSYQCLWIYLPTSRVATARWSMVVEGVRVLQ